MRLFTQFLFCCAASIFFLSCKKDSNTNTPATGNGTMTAKVAGASFTASLAVQASKSGGVLSVAGTGSDGQINIAIPSYTGPATYTIGGGAFTTATYATTSAPITAYSANTVIGSGNVVVTEETGGYVKGTFSFTAYGSGGTTSKAITEGNFNIKLQ